MKRVIISLLASICALTAWAQGGNTGTGGSDGDYASLSERVLNLEKKGDQFNFFFNYGSSFQVSDAGGDWGAAFRAKQLRLEVKGSFGDHLSYRLRHRMNKSQAAMSEENFAKATDIMMVSWKFNDKFTLMGGKMCQFWGGYEFDENPMYIYQYSDMVDYMDNFLAGVALAWYPLKGQEFVFNVTNSYSGKFASEYGAAARTMDGLYLKGAAFPLAYIVNWNGSLFGGLLTTRWSLGSYTQAQSNDGSKLFHDRMVFLGQSLNLPKLQWYFDYMGAFESLDRLRIVTGDLGGGYATDVRYNSFVTKLNWHFTPGFNLMLKGMYETAGLASMDAYKRVSLGYVGALEYYPLKDQDFRVFVAYVGRDCKYEGVRLDNYHVNRLELGFMYRIKAY